MALTKTFNSNKWQETIIDIFYEWLTNVNCFDSQSVGRVLVSGYGTVGNERLEVPRCEYEIINVLNESTGAGRTGAGGVKTNAVLRTVFMAITLKASRSDAGGRAAELNLIREADTLDKYFRTDLGGGTLGASGLRKANLAGPFKDNNLSYYQQRHILSFQIEVA